MAQKSSIAKKILSILAILICIVLIPLLVMNLTIIVKSYTNPDEVPDFFGIKPFIVVTGSMEGTIDAGDLVITKNVDPATLQVGDIISYREGESVITHRIVDLTEQEGAPAFVTKGDANNAEDTNPVTYDQVESIYMFNIAGMGNVAMYMQTPTGMLAFVGIPLCCFILYDIIRRRLDRRKGRQEDEEAQTELDELRARLARMERESVTTKVSKEAQTEPEELTPQLTRAARGNVPTEEVEATKAELDELRARLARMERESAPAKVSEKAQAEPEELNPQLAKIERESAHTDNIRRFDE